MRVNTNVPSLISYNALNSTNKALQKAIERLSTGLRVNSAADDAAGLAISEKMRAQSRGLDQAVKNAQDGISMIQTAEGAMNESHSILQRMRELSVQAANDTLTANDRQFIQLEIDQLAEELDRIAYTTQFNRKKLLDGSASVLWSTDNLSTGVIVRGALAGKDQFGQRTTAEGNYRIEITATHGAAQVQKSNIFQATGEASATAPITSSGPAPTPTAEIDITTGTGTGGGWSFDAVSGVLEINGPGVYKIVGNGNTTANSIRVASSTADIILSDVVIDRTGSNDASPLDMRGATVNLYLEGDNSLIADEYGHAGIFASEGSTLTITSAAGDGSASGSLYVQGGSNSAGIGGVGSMVSIPPPTSDFNGGTITINGGTVTATTYANGSAIGGGAQGNGGTVTINGGVVTANGKGILNPLSNPGAGIGGGAGGDGGTTIITGGTVTAIGGGMAAGIGGGEHGNGGNTTITGGTVTAVAGDYGIASASNIGHGYEISTALGTLSDGTTTLGGGAVITGAPIGTNGSITITFGAMRPLVSAPTALSIYQGDGKMASLTLYELDTMLDVMRKINDAIAVGLGQSDYTDNADNFCTIADGAAGTSESVLGTLVIRSAIAGKAGELHFAGDEDLLKALGLSTIQESSENRFSVSVYDAHTGNLVNPAQAIAGNVLRGAINGNIDIKFDAMANIDVSWNEAGKAYVLTDMAGTYTTFVHLADNTTTLQIGANEREEMTIGLGDITSSALGLDGILVVSRELAAEAVTRIDGAINILSRQRANLGAYQNRLEHTITNLTVTSTNMKEAESRIRDADMAKEMIGFTRLNILSQAGNSMLAQANQLPSNILTLLR